MQEYFSFPSFGRISLVGMKQEREFIIEEIVNF
jgi:hypothetical protein